MIYLIIIIKILGLSWVITKFDPLYWILEAIKKRIEQKNLILNLIMNVIITITTCFSCCSMWIGFLIGGFWFGILSYIIAFIYTKKLSLWETKITFK